jgi:hypothetical protein
MFFDIARAAMPRSSAKRPERIAALYAIETTIRGHSAEARRAARQDQSRPLVAALRAWLEHQLCGCPEPSATPDRVVEYRLLFMSGEQKPAHDAVRAWVRGFWKVLGHGFHPWKARLAGQFLTRRPATGRGALQLTPLVSPVSSVRFVLIR